MENKIRYMFIIGETEYANNKIILKDLKNSTETLIDCI